MARAFELTSPDWQFDEENDVVVCVGVKNDDEQIQAYSDCNYKTQLARIKAAVPYQGFDVDEEDIDDDTQDIQSVVNRFQAEKTANIWKYENKEVTHEEPKDIESQTLGETLPAHGEKSTQEEPNG